MTTTPALVTSSAQAATQRIRGNHVLLRAESLNLLLPQSDVSHAEFLEGELEPVDGNGLFQRAGESADGLFFVALSHKLRPLTEPPTDRFLVTTLGSSGPELRWCWNDVHVLIDLDLPAHELPPVLRAPYTPVSQYALYQGQMVYLSRAQQVFDFVFPGRS